MSTINVQCTDQVLAITNSPVIASGGINENYIQFTFCSLWTGYAKICVFYQQKGSYYYSLVDSEDKCKIPAECCTSAGKIYFGVVGTKDDVTRTSEVLGYQIVEGAVTTIADPTPDIYQQILSELAEIRKELEAAAMNITGLTAATTIANDDYFPIYKTSATANRKLSWATIVSKIRSVLFGTSSGFLKADGSGTVSAVSNVGTSDIADGAITSAKLADSVNSSIESAASKASAALPMTGGTMTGALTANGIKLTSGTDYGDSLPSAGTAGRLFFKKVT